MSKIFLNIRAVLLILIFSFIICALGLYANNEENEIPKLTVSELKEKIKENRNKVLIVDFWATWCPPCKEEIPGFINIYKNYKDKGVEILGIALDAEGSKSVKPFAKEMGINYQLYIGGFDINREYEVVGLPTTLIFDKNGKLKVRHVGYASQNEFEQEIAELLK